MLVDIKIKDIEILQNLLNQDMDKIIKLKKKYKFDMARVSILNDEYKERAVLDANLEKIKQILGGESETNK